MTDLKTIVRAVIPLLEALAAGLPGHRAEIEALAEKLRGYADVGPGPVIDPG